MQGILKWVKGEIEAGRKDKVKKKLEEAYANELNPWSPFFKSTGAGGKGLVKQQTIGKRQ